jgi:DNA polymerase III gamma/tau subunit
LGRAEQLLSKGTLQLRDDTIHGLNHALDGDLADVLEFADKLGGGRNGRQNMETLLEVLEWWFRDVLFVQLAVRPGLIANQDRLKELEESAGRSSSAVVMNWISRIRSIRTSLRVNANPCMAAEAMLLKLRNDAFGRL